MRNIICTCAKCGLKFFWSFQERVDSINDIKIEDASNTKRFKLKLAQATRPTRCGGCRKDGAVEKK